MKEFALLVMLHSLLAPFANGAEARAIEWRAWEARELFKTLAKPLVVLDLQAVWCHWCHVMDEKTYADPRVIALMNENALAVKVDQDSRPDLSKKYEDYGWPATIFFDSKGRELAKRAGFIEPDEMVALLAALSKNPVPESEDQAAAARAATKAADTPLFPKVLREELTRLHLLQYDQTHQGWGRIHKFLFGEPEELALRQAWLGDKKAKALATGALSSALVLIDPAWGGAYQYSVGSWHEPHFEKIAKAQADNLTLYSLGYGVTGDRRYARAAESVRSYLERFFASPEGAFYTSQDADLVRGVHSASYFRLADLARRAKGMPAIDTHRYARENGWMIQALATHYAMTGEERSIVAALKAVTWVAAHRAVPAGGFRHGEAPAEKGLYLGDTLEMGWAFLKLYDVTADQAWLVQAREAGRFIAEHFKVEPAGFLTSVPVPSEPARDENIRAARFFNLLSRITGDTQERKLAEHAMRWVAAPARARELPTAGPLLAELELSSLPVHVSVVGPKKDPKARALFEAALRVPSAYRRIEWWDPAEGPPLNSDVTYPKLSYSAAYACTGGRCSVPLTHPQDLRAKLERLLK